MNSWKRHIVWLVLLLTAQSVLFAQLVPFRKDYKWGYKDLETGKIIEPRFNVVSDFNHWGMAVVSTNDGDRIMDTNGVFLTETNGEIYEPFNQHLYKTLAPTGSTFSLRSFETNKILWENLEYIRSLNPRIQSDRSELLLVKRNGLAGVIRNNGELLIPLKYESVKTNNMVFYARLPEQPLTHTYSRTGEIIDSGAYSTIRRNSNATFSIQSLDGNKTGLLDENKKTLIPPRWDNFSKTENPNLFVVNDDGHRPHLFNVALQKTIDPFPFSSIMAYPQGFLKLFNGTKCGLIDLEGNVIMQDTFDLIVPWTEHAIIAKKDKRYGVFDEKGTLKSGMIYRLITPINSSKVALFIDKKGNCGMYNSKGKNIIPCEHKSIERSGNIFRTRKGDITMHYTVDKEGDIISAKEIKNLHVLSLNKFKLHEKFEKIHMGEENPVENRLTNFDPRVYRDDSLRIWLQLQGNYRIGYRIYDMGRGKALCDYMLDNFNIGELAQNRLTVVGIRSKRRENVLVTNRGMIRNVFRWQSQSFNLTEVRDKQGYIEFETRLNPGLKGLISKKTGQVLLPPVYKEIQSIKNDLVIAQLKGHGWGAIKLTGEIVVPFEFTRVEYDDFNNPKYIKTYMKSDKTGYVDSLGHEITEIKYDRVQPFEGGFAEVRCDQNWTFIDVHGNELVPPKYDRVKPFNKGLAPVRFNNKWGFINEKGEETIPPKYENAGEFGNGLAAVREEDLYGYINRKGNIVIPEKYQKAKPFKNGLAVVKKNNSYGIIDTNGNWVVSPHYGYIHRMNSGFELRKRRNKHFLCSETGEVFTREKYREITYLNEGRYAVRKRRFYKIVNALGEVKSDVRMSKVSDFVMGHAWVRTGRGWGVIDTSGEMVLADTFQYHWDFTEEGIASAKVGDDYIKLIIQNGQLDTLDVNYFHPDDHYLGTFNGTKVYRTAKKTRYDDPIGMEDEHHKLLLPSYYSTITNFTNGFACIRIDDKKGLYTLDGIKICDAEYEHVEAIETNKGIVYMLRKGGKIGYVNDKGEWILNLEN